MANQSPEVVTKYEVLFALRTGLTIMFPKMKALDNEDKGECIFETIKENNQDILVKISLNSVIIKGLKESHIEASVSQGFIMLYETDGDEVVRNTVCNYKV